MEMHTSKSIHPSIHPPAPPDYLSGDVIYVQQGVALCPFPLHVPQLFPWECR